MPFYSRKSPRIPDYDYATENYYFITICTHQHRCIFGQPEQLNPFGSIAKKDLQSIPKYYSGVAVDKYVVMPNHIHVILALQNKADHPDISQIIALYKTGVTKQIHVIEPNLQVWQRSFYDHIIRNRDDYREIWTYIDNNPIKWKLDKFYTDRF